MMKVRIRKFLINPEEVAEAALVHDVKIVDEGSHWLFYAKFKKNLVEFFKEDWFPFFLTERIDKCE